MTDTQPFMDEARKLLDSLGACNCVECTEHIATALSSAYQRGREDEREACAKICESLSWHVDISPDHIRSRRPIDYATAIRTERDNGRA